MTLSWFIMLYVLQVWTYCFQKIGKWAEVENGGFAY